MGFWELAPGWIWLLGPVVGVLAGTQHRHAEPDGFRRYVGGLCRGRRAALGAGEPAARRLRAPGRRRARPGITRVANAVRSRLVGRRAPCRRGIRRQGRSRSARRGRGAGDAAGNRPHVIPVGRMATADALTAARRRDRLAVAAARDLRTLSHAQPHPHRARHVPDIHVRRYPGGRPFHLRSRLVRLHLLSRIIAAPTCTTKGSMPAMLAGVAFRNETAVCRVSRTHHPTIFHALGQQGYRLRSLTSHGQ